MTLHYFLNENKREEEEEGWWAEQEKPCECAIFSLSWKKNNINECFHMNLKKLFIILVQFRIILKENEWVVV